MLSREDWVELKERSEAAVKQGWIIQRQGEVLIKEAERMIKQFPVPKDVKKENSAVK